MSSAMSSARSIPSLPLLLEIGTEEIPDWMIAGALESLRALFEKLEIPHQSLRLDATPRRLVLRAEGLPQKQDDSDKRTLGPLTSGHRRLGAREIAITTADYEQRLRDHGVILSADERRNRILSGMTGIRYRPDPALLETLVYFTECPQPIAGSFDPQFLELP